MIGFLPPQFEFDNLQLLKQTIKSSRALGELKGTIATIPNEKIFLDTLIITEAKSSSAIENIVTTYSELYRAKIDETNISSATKEVRNYADAVKFGYELIKKKELLTVNHILDIQKINVPKYGEIRRLKGTVIVDQETGKIVHTPPQSYDEIIELLTNLEKFINDLEFSDLDPLIKMPIIHYQFESIHPFYDGNGRMGRILNVLYLTQQGLLDWPILYLSKYIIENKADYYRLLREVKEKENWLDWCQWFLKGIEETAKDMIEKINAIKSLMLDYKHHMRKYKFYSQDLINLLFQYPYTKIKLLENELKISRFTAAKYLEILTKDGYLNKIKLGRDSFYFNISLLNILTGEQSFKNM